MGQFVLTAIGDDRAGLVEALAGVVAAEGGNWERSHMAELAGKFAGIVVVTVPDDRADSFCAALETLGEVLDVTATVAAAGSPDADLRRLQLDIVALDRPGLLHEVSTALSSLGVSIDSLHTETRSAPMSGGELFQVDAVLTLPTDRSPADVRSALDEMAEHLALDVDLREVEQ